MPQLPCKVCNHIKPLNGASLNILIFDNNLNPELNISLETYLVAEFNEF